MAESKSGQWGDYHPRLKYKAVEDFYIAADNDPRPVQPPGPERDGTYEEHHPKINLSGGPKPPPGAYERMARINHNDALKTQRRSEIVRSIRERKAGRENAGHERG